MGDLTQVELSRDEARSLTSEIQRSMRGLQELIIRAYNGRAWSALGYATWDAYCDGELAGARPALPRDERREIVSDLRDAGLSTRAIGSALGIGNKTVHRDIRDTVSNDTVEMPVSNPFAVDSAEDAGDEPSDGGLFPAPEPTVRPVTGVNGKTYAPKPAEPVTGPVWSAEQSAMRDAVERGETVVASLRGDHALLIAWAQQAGRYVRIDRRSDWGNPFEMPGDGDRETVIRNYAEHYLPHKPSLANRLHELRGKVLGCWCAPEPCHGDVLKNGAER